jgi:dihydroorotase-like cyclic amidohydrolase
VGFQHPGGRTVRPRAEIADVPIYIVHLSAAEALEMVTEARDRGLPVLSSNISTTPVIP